MTVRIDLIKGGVVVTQPSRESYTLRDVHPATQCEGRACVIHNPTDHKMSYWPLEWTDNGGFSRQCSHGFSHPDPDGLAFWATVGGSALKEHQWHLCDGCCGMELPELNRAKCGVCGDIITSYSRHDFVRCSCGESFVDGGFDYRRWGGQATPVNVPEQSSDVNGREQ